MQCILLLDTLQANLTEVTQSRDALEEEKENLLAEQLELTAELEALHEQLSSAESLNQLYEAKIGEQQSQIDSLTEECKQVSAGTVLLD